MSIPLLKKSLELADSPFTYKTLPDKSKESKGEKIYTVVKLSKQKKNKSIRGVSDVKNKNINNVDLLKKKLKRKQDKIRDFENVIKILKKPVIGDRDADTILQRNSKPTFEEFIPVKEPEGTVFTEEDFQKFEREYFG